MRSIHIVKGLAFCTALGFLGVALGCSGAECNNGHGGSGGADAGPGCTWDGTGGGVTIPDCSAYRETVNFVGTVDGKPYDNLIMDNILTSHWPDGMNPQTMNMPLPAGGSLYLEWARPTVWGKWIDVTGGTLQLPLGITRAVLPGSKVRLKCGAAFYQFILVVEGAQLNACSVN
jgi:hypothetical protein